MTRSSRAVAAEGAARAEGALEQLRAALADAGEPRSAACVAAGVGIAPRRPCSATSSTSSPRSRPALAQTLPSPGRPQKLLLTVALTQAPGFRPPAATVSIPPRGARLVQYGHVLGTSPTPARGCDYAKIDLLARTRRRARALARGSQTRYQSTPRPRQGAAFSEHLTPRAVRRRRLPARLHLPRLRRARRGLFRTRAARVDSVWHLQPERPDLQQDRPRAVGAPDHPSPPGSRGRPRRRRAVALAHVPQALARRRRARAGHDAPLPPRRRRAVGRPDPLHVRFPGLDAEASDSCWTR